MSWRMVTDSEIRHLPVPEKLFSYADSYLRAAALCERLPKEASCTWADGAVVLMLSAHATEVFLKAVLLKRAPEATVWARGHDIEALAADYLVHFPEPEFSWEVPFKTEYPDGMSDGDIAALKSLRDAPPSILYRYPVQKSGADWSGLYGFEPSSFLPVLERLRDDFKRIRGIVAE